MKKTKRLKINISKLSIGGMERSFLNFLNMSDIVKESDTTVLIGYVTDQNLLKQIPKNVHYHIITKKWNLLGKVYTSIYLACTIIKTTFLRDQYDCSISYSYQHGSIAKLTRNESKNNIIFIHTNLSKSRTPKMLKHLIRKIKFDKFSKVICVSNNAKKDFMKLFPKYAGQSFVINNFINDQEILKKSKAPIDFKKTTTTFLNVCRHENDRHKKVSRILKATKQLKKEGCDFEVVLIGAGPEDPKYQKYISENNLSRYVKMLGAKPNPFPYFLQSDAFVMSSAYEGYGIVLDESRVLKLPIISTNIGDAKQIISENYGILCDNSTEGVYQGMKTFLRQPKQYNRNFSAYDFNSKINSQLNEVIFS